MVITMQAITTYASAFFQRLTQLLQRRGLRQALEMLASGAAGFALSAASVSNRPLPLALGLLCAAPPGLYSLAAALGGALGYWLLWKEAQGLAWMGLGLLAVLLVGDGPAARQQRLLLPALAAVVVSGTGLGQLLLFGDDTPLWCYLLRVWSAGGAAACFRAWRVQPKGAAEWVVGGIFTLALAQLAPVSWLNLGFLAAAFLCLRLPLPGAAMAGLGLDLAGVTRVPMTGVLCLAFLPRMTPRGPKWLPALSPALSFWAVSVLSGSWAILPGPGLFLGGIAGALLPGGPTPVRSQRRTGQTGLAQTRLEQAADAMATLERALLLTREPEIDRAALLSRAAADCCDTCPERRGCKARGKVPALPPKLLEQPEPLTAQLPPGCKKPQRLMVQLRREQSKFRSLRAQEARLLACRSAMAEQYQFLSDYLRELSEDLCTLQSAPRPRFRPEIGVSARSRGSVSGDRWARLSPRETLCDLIVCDGMGTGEEAAADAEEALSLLGQLLEAGFSPEQALRCFNSLSTLRDTGGSATVDLVRLDLRAGTAVIYKWGAAASYLLRAGQLKKIGTAGPPPGLSQQARELKQRLSLGGEDVLILLSDGVGTEGLAQPQWTAPEKSAGEMACSILEHSAAREDDATVMVIRLVPLCPDTP